MVIVSDILKNEVDPAPKCVHEFFAAFPEFQIEQVTSTEESNALAAQYVAKKVVGPTSLDGCKSIRPFTNFKTSKMGKFALQNEKNFSVYCFTRRHGGTKRSFLCASVPLCEKKYEYSRRLANSLSLQRLCI